MRRRSMWRALATTLVLSGLMVGTAELGSTPVGSVANGLDIPTAQPWTALVTQNKVSPFGTNFGWESRCTGTLISKAWVLTAAHCVAYSQKNSPPVLIPSSKMRVVLGRNNINAASPLDGVQYTVTQIVPARDSFQQMLHIRKSLSGLRTSPSCT